MDAKRMHCISDEDIAKLAELVGRMSACIAVCPDCPGRQRFEVFIKSATLLIGGMHRSGCDTYGVPQDEQ